MYAIKAASNCRACGSENLKLVLPLKEMPPGDKYVEDKSKVPTINLPSGIQHCRDCNHLQMIGFTDADYIYETYLSRPASTNPELESAYKQYASELVQLSKEKPILEVGSNDGLFLAFIKAAGGRAVGIEPAQNLCNIAESRNVNTINDYVNNSAVEKAMEILEMKPGLILANHSFSNVEDIQEWGECLSNALDEDGYLVLQTFYQIDVLKKHMIENYNHEHLSYLTIKGATKFFAKFGLALERAKHLPAKGGSIRFYFKKGNVDNLDEETTRLIDAEESVFNDIDSSFQATSDYITSKGKHLRKLLNEIDGDSKVAAYGTSIGATVFCYQFGIEDKIKCFFDDDKLRQNRYSPGTGIKVLPGRSTAMNDYSHIVILAPLYADAIIRNNLEYLKNGGTFVKFWPNVEAITIESLEK